VPGLIDAGNVVVHLGEYTRGSGQLQQDRISHGVDAAAVARDFWPFGYDPRTGKIQVGPYQIDVEGVSVAATQLLHAIATAARQIDAQTD
jgi:hypothetical protein